MGLIGMITTSHAIPFQPVASVSLLSSGRALVVGLNIAKEA